MLLVILTNILGLEGGIFKEWEREKLQRLQRAGARKMLTAVQSGFGGGAGWALWAKETGNETGLSRAWPRREERAGDIQGH